MDNISRFQKTTGVGQILDESFARCPEREAIVFGDWRIFHPGWPHDRYHAPALRDLRDDA